MRVIVSKTVCLSKALHDEEVTCKSGSSSVTSPQPDFISVRRVQFTLRKTGGERAAKTEQPGAKMQCRGLPSCQAGQHPMYHSVMQCNAMQCNVM